MKILILLLAIAVMPGAWAQDQMMVRMNHPGLIQVMRMALKYNQRGAARPGFKIPAGLYSFKIKKADLAKNPIVQIITQLTDLDLTRDLPFHVTNSEVSVEGSIDETSLTTAVSNYTAKGFDLRVSFNVSAVNLKVADISLCETKNGLKCGKGLKASFKNVAVGLKNDVKLTVSADFQVAMDTEQARLKLIRVNSNLGTLRAPKLNITLGQVVVPPVIVIINGQEAEIDTSSIRQEILNRRTFLAENLLNFAGEFIAKDLVVMVNKALKNQCLPTRLRVLDINEKNGQPFVEDINEFGIDKDVTPLMDLIQQDLATIIKSVQLDLGLKSVQTPLQKDIELRADASLRLNQRSWTVGNTIGNSHHTLPPLSIDNRVNRADHLAMVISEPVINAGLQLFQDMGVFQKLLDSQAKMGGVYIDSIKTHFRNGMTSQTDTIFVIVNARVKLKETEADNFWSWLQRSIAVWLERNNNKSELRFPLQFVVIPKVVKKEDGTVKLMLKVNSPFERETVLYNSYRYPNDITEANGMVRDAVLKKLREALLPQISREFEFPLDAYLSLKGITVMPKSIQLLDSSYLMVSANMTKLDFAALDSVSEESLDVAACQPRP